MDNKIDVIFDEMYDTLKNIQENTKFENIDSHLKMANVINDVNSNLKRYKRYSNPNFFQRLTTNESIANANLILCEYEFNRFLSRGNDLKIKVLADVKKMEATIASCHETIESFETMKEQLENMSTSDNQYNRIDRKMDDLNSAIIMTSNTIAQLKLTISNIYIIYDKFMTIDKILRPLLEQNIKLSKNDTVELLKYL